MILFIGPIQNAISLGTSRAVNRSGLYHTIDPGPTPLQRQKETEIHTCYPMHKGHQHTMSGPNSHLVRRLAELKRVKRSVGLRAFGSLSFTQSKYQRKQTQQMLPLAPILS